VQFASTLRAGTSTSFLTPEIPLLYKSREPRQRDETDFRAVLPSLSVERRHWLAEAIRSREPEHPWVERLLR